MPYRDRVNPNQVPSPPTKPEIGQRVKCTDDRGGPSLSRFLHTVSSAALLRWRLSDGLVAHPLC